MMLIIVPIYLTIHYYFIIHLQQLYLLLHLHLKLSIFLINLSNIGQNLNNNLNHYNQPQMVKLLLPLLYHLLLFEFIIHQA